MTTTAMMASCAKMTDSHLNMLIGTYTEGNDSRGIYLCDFKQEDASYKILDTAFVGNPSFVVPSADGKHAYAVSEYDNGSQGVCALRMLDNKIELHGAVMTTNGHYDGGAPCNVLVVGNHVITSNYMGGSLSAFPILHDGSLGSITAQYAPEADSLQSSHMHCAMLSPEGKYIFATDLGHDAIYRFSAGDDVDLFKDVQIAYQFDKATHAGPRHMTFSPDGRHLYLLHELGDLITVFFYNNGELKHISTEKAYDGRGHGSADIHVSPDGRFLYTSHRLKEDGISVFCVNDNENVNDNCTLKRIGFQPTGIHPRNFAITPNGKYLLCACRDSNRIEIYAVNAENGTLEATGKSIDIPAPVCVQWVL